MVGKQSNPFEHSPTSDNSANRDLSALVVKEVTSETQKPKCPSAIVANSSKSWKVWLTAFGACCVLGGVGASAFWWLTTPPPSPDCQKLSLLTTDMERLLCAQENARSGDILKVLAGLELVSQWTPDHPLYREAQRLVAEWSKPVLVAAQERIDRSDLQGAIVLASRIPKTSPLYKETQAAVSQWKRYWQKGEAISNAARIAMKQQQWFLAQEKIENLRQFSQDYWRYDRVTTLSKLLTAEQQGRQTLSQAQTLSKGRQLEHLAAAIAQLNTIDTRTYAWADAQHAMTQWSEILLSQGWQYWQQGKLDEAMAFAQPVLKTPTLGETAQELLWLSQARKHFLASTTTLKPSLSQIWNLSAAISTMQLIPATSRYSKQAQPLLKNWQAQLQDLTLLQLAWNMGDVAYPLAKQFSIWQASQITSDRPRRFQAQTLISIWQVDIHRLEDQPYLVYARQLAQPGTIAALNSAIAQAKLVTPKRPSRKTAQTLIATWIGQIQTIQDQPILDRASTIASQGNLQTAIQVASTIAPGRALHPQAQSAINGWQASIQAAELARIREQEAALRRSSMPQTPPPTSDNQPSEPEQPHPPRHYDNQPSWQSEPPISSSSAPAYKKPAPSFNDYPPGTEPPPSQIPIAPPAYAPTYEPPPPPSYYPPYEPVPPPPTR